MRQPFFEKCILTLLLALFLLAPAPSFGADQDPTVSPKTLYIVPFLNVMVPEEVSSHLFDSFIDQLMAVEAQSVMQVRILKKDIDSVDKDWLAQQHFVTGELFGYEEDSGCCSTVIKAKIRLYRFQPGLIDPAAEIIVPGDVFFEHDVTTLQKERILLAERMARELSQKLAADLMPTR